MNHRCENSTTDPETLVLCPYDSTHMVRVKRLTIHLVKCAKNHPDKVAASRTCPFNARHVLPVHAVRHHQANCPDQCIIHQEVIAATSEPGDCGPPVGGCTDVPPVNNDAAVASSGEDWDEDCRRRPVTVDPTMNQPTTVSNRTGLTAAQRREYRKLIKQHYELKCAGQPTDAVEAAIKRFAKSSFISFTSSSALDDPMVASPLNHTRPALAATVVNVNVNQATSVTSSGVMRRPHGPPQVDMVHAMNGVKADDGENGHATRLAARFNNVNVADGSDVMRGVCDATRGVAPTGRGFRKVTFADDDEKYKNDLKKKYAILQSMSAGRGTPKR